ncbi:hypothetical protein IVB22_05385 [Bradyrhizobium sp. 190]|uniref:hypothetical protein n=1 Tax=Bradyrhizobium sp. 190 TaxID=2782658 RepID=UPI001FFA6E6F|nr:hypothetical protein [Bradyrhizobium sp. 190]MCK1512008.1 hypothetical protein [Bradyrhizobium sp. 190]
MTIRSIVIVVGIGRSALACIRGAPAMKNGVTGTTTGSSRPSPKDTSTQGTGTAGAVDKKGDAISPGETMKK